MSQDWEKRRGKVTDLHREEARALLEIWNRVRDERARLGQINLTQLEFAREHRIGETQGAVSNRLTGKQPLSLKAAIGFAKGLGCKVGDFSPRLQTELDDLSSSGAATGKGPATPGQLLATVFDALPDVFPDGGTKLDLLQELANRIQNRPHLWEKRPAPNGEPTVPRAAAQKTPREAGRTR